MKKLSVVLLVALLMALLPAAVGAQAPVPGVTFNTAFRVQNLGTAAANCVFSFYDTAGVEKYNSGAITPAIPIGQSYYLYVPSLGTAVGAGQYSAVVSCDQNVAAVVNISNSTSTAAKTSQGDAYNGISSSQVASTLFAPGIYKNYYNFYSNVVVQNAGTGQTAISLQIFAPGNPTPVVTQGPVNVNANGFTTFSQTDAALTSNVAYSAKVVTNPATPVAAVVNIYGLGNVTNQLYSYNASAAGSTTAYAPVIMNKFYGNNTALVIQNMGTQPARVRITYSDVNGTVVNSTIAAGSADSRYTPGETGIASGNTNGLYSAKVESLADAVNGNVAQPILVLVNESNSANRASSYNGFVSGTTSVSAPIIMRRYYNYNTSVTCQNVGGAAATMSMSIGGKTQGFTTPTAIAANGTFLFYQPGDSRMADGEIGSATITSAQPIVCVVNQDMNEAPFGSQSLDALAAYNGIGFTQ